MKNKIICIGILTLLIFTTYPVYGAINQSNYKDPEATFQESDWPMFRYDAQNTGCTDSLAPATNQLRWQSSISDAIMQTTPIVVEDKMYLSTGWYYMDLPPPNMTDFNQNDYPVFQDYVNDLIAYREEYWGGIYCLDAETGGQLWNRDLYSPNEPAVIDGRVYTTDFNLYGYWSSLYCLDADTGGTIWSSVLPGLMISPTIVAEDSIILSTLDLYSYSGVVRCYNTEGIPQWSYTLPPNEVIWFSAPAIYDGKVYFITSDTYSYYYGDLYCIDLETGQYIWSQPISSFFFFFGSTSPVCSDGKVYAVEFNLYSYQGTLKCYNANTGSPLWNYNLGFIITFEIPAINDDYAFVTGFDLYSYYCWLYKISLDNQTLMWKVPVPSLSYFFGSGSPICSTDKVLVSPSGFYSYTNQMYCYDINSGSVVWDYQFNDLSMCTPSIADDTVYMADMSGNIYAIADQMRIAEISGGLMGVKVAVENIGSTPMEDINWEIDCIGGIFELIDKTSEGTIATLAAGSTDIVRAFPVFGLGTMLIEATIYKTGLTPIRKTAEAMIIGPFIIIN